MTGTYITKDLTWTLHTSNLVKKAQQRMFFLRKLRKAGLAPQFLNNFYRSTIESILCQGCTVWYSSCTAEDRRNLARVVKTAERIVGAELPDLDFVYAECMQRRDRSICTDNSHPGHSLFVPLPSGKRYRTIKTWTNRFRKSFFPRAVASINTPKHTN